jgi:hypothetical protein
MAQEAVQAGLLLDEAMLPAAEDPLAPQHESRLNWSRKDRLTPTIRQVCGAQPEVTLLERLWKPLTEAGADEAVINESLHPSLTRRFGKGVVTLANDAATTGDAAPYRPKNLVPLLKT